MVVWFNRNDILYHCPMSLMDVVNSLEYKSFGFLPTHFQPLRRMKSIINEPSNERLWKYTTLFPGCCMIKFIQSLMLWCRYTVSVSSYSFVDAAAQTSVLSCFFPFCFSISFPQTVDSKSHAQKVVAFFFPIGQSSLSTIPRLSINCL